MQLPLFCCLTLESRVKFSQNTEISTSAIKFSSDTTFADSAGVVLPRKLGKQCCYCNVIIAPLAFVVLEIARVVVKS